MDIEKVFVSQWIEEEEILELQEAPCCFLLQLVPQNLTFLSTLN